MSLADLETLAKDLEAIVLDIRQGKLIEAAEVSVLLIRAATNAIPVEMLKADLTEQDRTFVDLRVDIAEQTKVDAAADAAEAEKLGAKS